MKKIVLPIILGMFVAATAVAPLSSVALAQAPAPKPAQMKKDPCGDIKDAKKKDACMKKEAKKKAPKKDKKEKKKTQ
ncbi:MAG: hypothetical protein VW338_09905 [Rhodospirillaceae bacterium]|jgi:hypothetical protein